MWDDWHLSESSLVQSCCSFALSSPRMAGHSSPPSHLAVNSRPLPCSSTMMAVMPVRQCTAPPSGAHLPRGEQQALALQ